jgi:hypothetical protein
MKKLTNQDYAQALYDVTQEIPDTIVSAAVKEFAHLLVRRGKAGSVDDIIHRLPRERLRECETVGDLAELVAEVAEE